MLWLALHTPCLSLEIFSRTAPGDHPLAVTEAQRLVSVNSAAKACGIRPGMRPAQALSLLPTLTLVTRQPAAERDVLRRLADAALSYSSHVSRHGDEGLLLEIGASLRLFGGLECLLARVERELAPLGFRLVPGVAPTPTAAWLLARAGDRRPVTDMRGLRERLANLSCKVLDPAPEQRLALEGLGLRTLGDCLALPASDLDRRLGGDIVARLERALGRHPDPRPAHRPRPVFHGEIPLPAETRDSQAVLFALQRLLRELEAMLRSLDAGVQRVRLGLHHQRHPVTRLVLGLQSPGRDAARLLAVARERLERSPLPAPVTALTLEANRLLNLAPETPALLDSRSRQSWQQLAERLTARLGETAVTGLSTAPDYRPEQAWLGPPPGNRPEQRADPHRPLWLLPSPQPLECRDGLPRHHGPLQLLRGPERIETGWWDGDDVSRDYYEARNPRGARLWIFHDLRGERGWFLQGYFS